MVDPDRIGNWMATALGGGSGLQWARAGRHGLCHGLGNGRRAPVQCVHRVLSGGEEFRINGRDQKEILEVILRVRKMATHRCGDDQILQRRRVLGRRHSH